MQPNRPASSSGGRGESRVRSTPQWVVRASRPLASLHSRRLGPAKCGGFRARSAVGQVARPSLRGRRRTYSRPCGAFEARRGERWHVHPRSAGPLRRPGRSRPFDERVASLPAVSGPCWSVRPGGRLTPCAVVAWLAVGCIRPVLKHGPRSAAVARVVRVWKPVSMRNEGEGGTCGPPRREPFARHIVDRSVATPWRDSSESVAVATRKMVNYA